METASARRAALLFSLLGAALLLAGGIALWRLLPRVQLPEEAEPHGESYLPPHDIPSVLPAPHLSGIRVAVVEEPANVQVTAEGYLDGEIQRWEEWLGEAGARLVAPAEAEVLVFPHAECLDLGARALLVRHLQEGGGVISTGPLGARDGECRELRDTVLVELLGRNGERTPFVRPQQPSPHVVVLGETMLGAQIPPGARAELSPMHRLVFRDPGRGVYFSDYNRQPARVGEEAYLDAAATRALVGRGRVVALGFGLSEVAPGWSEAVMRLLAANAVQWAAGRPVVHLAPWPAGYRAAAVVAQDVEADFANASGAVDVIERHDIPATYFLVGQLAKQNRWVTRSMVQSGEIASHSYHHQPMDRFSDQGQSEELALAKRETEELSGSPVLGFRPPQERYTKHTLQAWAELGGEYVFTYNNMRAAAPEIVPYGRDSLVLLGRVVDDDFEILNRSGVRDRGRMVRNMVQQVEETIDMRGLYAFSYHSHMFAQRALLPVLEELVEALKERPQLWLATGLEVARWWRTRAAIQLEVAPDGASVTVHNPGPTPFREGVLLVERPDGRQERLTLPEIAPGARVRVALP